MVMKKMAADFDDEGQIISSNDEKMRRKSSNDSVESMGKKSTTIRLFGVNITVDHHDDDRDATTSHKIQDRIHVDEAEPSSRRKSSQEELTVKKPTTIRLFGVNINVDHLFHDATTSREIHGETGNKSRNTNLIVEEAPAPLPPPIILDQHPRFLFEKKLEKSDVTRSQNRLLITKSESMRLMAALTEEEKEKVLMHKTDSLRVLTTDGDGNNEYTLQLKKWSGTRAIILKHQWSDLVLANRLQVGESVQGWGYRVQPHEFRLIITRKIELD